MSWKAYRSIREKSSFDLEVFVRVDTGATLVSRYFFINTHSSGVSQFHISLSRYSRSFLATIARARSLLFKLSYRHPRSSVSSSLTYFSAAPSDYRITIAPPRRDSVYFNRAVWFPRTISDISSFRLPNVLYAYLRTPRAYFSHFYYRLVPFICSNCRLTFYTFQLLSNLRSPRRRLLRPLPLAVCSTLLV